MRLPWKPCSAKAKLPPVERARRKVYRWKWVQVGALIINTIVAAALAGFLVSRDVGVAGGVVVPIIMAGVALLVTGLMNWFGRYVNGYWHRWYVVLVILADMTCIGTQVAAFIVLTVARLPVDCTGLTPISYRPDDPKNKPEPGYDTVGFGKPDERGELDGYCHAPRLSWLISILLIVSYLHTIGWAIRLFVALKRNRAQKRELEPESPQVQDDARPPPPAPAPTLPRYHINVPVGPRSEAPADEVEPVSPMSVSVPTPVNSPPPYEDDGAGAVLVDKKRRFGRRG